MLQCWNLCLIIYSKIFYPGVQLKNMLVIADWKLIEMELFSALSIKRPSIALNHTWRVWRDRFLPIKSSFGVIQFSGRDQVPPPLWNPQLAHSDTAYFALHSLTWLLFHWGFHKIWCRMQCRLNTSRSVLGPLYTPWTLRLGQYIWLNNQSMRQFIF